jgi:hypothetical protein
MVHSDANIFERDCAGASSVDLRPLLLDHVARRTRPEVARWRRSSVSPAANARRESVPIAQQCRCHRVQLFVGASGRRAKRIRHFRYVLETFEPAGECNHPVDVAIG